MIELVILLSISLIITMILGLLLAGFMWAPWLIGLALIVLLVSVMKAATGDSQASIQLAQGDGIVDPIVQPTVQPVESSTGQSADQSDASVMLYRGVKYKRHDSEASQVSTPSSATSGKYRGQVWKRSAQ